MIRSAIAFTAVKMMAFGPSEPSCDGTAQHMEPDYPGSLPPIAH